jgi:hypothetical protein
MSKIRNGYTVISLIILAMLVFHTTSNAEVSAHLNLEITDKPNKRCFLLTAFFMSCNCN